MSLLYAQFSPTEQTFLGFYIYTHHDSEDARQTWNDNKVRRVSVAGGCVVGGTYVLHPIASNIKFDAKRRVISGEACR